MKIDFLYSTDFLAMNAPELGHTCMHLLCTAGEGSFVFNERCYHIVKNDLVVMPNPTRAKNLAAAPGMEVEWFAADNKFLHSLLPSNNYSIGGSISLNQNPVIKVDDRQAEILLEDFHRLARPPRRPPPALLPRDDGEPLPDDDVRHLRAPRPARRHRHP